MQSLRQFTSAISKIKTDDFKVLVDYYLLHKTHMAIDKSMFIWESVVKTNSSPLIMSFSKYISKQVQNDWFYKTFKKPVKGYSESVILYLLKGKTLKAHNDIIINLISMCNMVIFKSLVANMCYNKLSLALVLILISRYGIMEMYLNIK